MTRRMITINIQRTPSISGFGGYDEWTIEDLDPDCIDMLMDKIDRAVKATLKSSKATGGTGRGGWTGSN